jgi:two-component system, OmpR family, response regulator
MNPHTHLLLVEDDTEISGMVSRFMSGHGIRVLVAANGKEFDCLVAENPIDLVVLDLMLPGESGLSICKRIRATSTVPVIMLTALGSEADRVVGLELGADDYLTKPFSARANSWPVSALSCGGATGSTFRNGNPTSSHSIAGA